MSTILSVSTAILGSLVFLFFYWKRLKEDYHPQLIFTAGFTVLLLAFFGVFLGTVLAGSISRTAIFDPQGLWFWTAAIGATVGFFINQIRYKFRIIEVFEATSIAGILLLGISARHFNGFLLCSALFFVFLFLNAKYRSFHWYRSGRVGFGGVVTLMLFFLSRVFLAFESSFSWFSAGKVDAFLSLLISFCLGFLLFNLSQTR